MTQRITPDRRPGPALESDVGDVYVLGGEAVGDAVARRLQEDERPVTRIDSSVRDDEVPTIVADPTDVTALESAGLSASSTAIVATSSDSRNLLIAQLVRSRFDVERVLVLVNDADRERVIADAGHEAVCATTALAETLRERV